MWLLDNHPAENIKLKVLEKLKKFMFAVAFDNDPKCQKNKALIGTELFSKIPIIFENKILSEVNGECLGKNIFFCLPPLGYCSITLLCESNE